MGYRVEVGLGFRRPRRNGEGPEVPAIPIEGGEVFEDVGVADAVKGIDAEAETDNEPVDIIEGGNGGKAGHVLFGRTEPGFITAQQNVGTPIDEHDGIDTEMGNEVPIGVAQRPDSNARKGVHNGRPALGIEPPGEGPLGEVGIIAGAAGTNGRDTGGEPVIEIEPVQITEGKVGEVDIFALRAKGNGKRKPGIDIEAPTGPGNKNTPSGTKPSKERRLKETVHRAIVRGSRKSFMD